MTKWYAYVNTNTDGGDFFAAVVDQHNGRNIVGFTSETKAMEILEEALTYIWGMHPKDNPALKLAGGDEQYDPIVPRPAGYNAGYITSVKRSQKMVIKLRDQQPVEPKKSRVEQDLDALE